MEIVKKDGANGASGTAVLDEIKNEMRTISVGVEKIRTNNEEQAQKLQSIETRLTKTEETILQKRISLPGTEDLTKKFSFVKAFRGIALERHPEIGAKAWEGAGLEREVFEQTRKKTQAGDLDVSGGHTLPVEMATQFIDLVYAQTVFDKVGVTKISGLKGQMLIRGLAAGATAYWHGENAAVSPSNPEWLQKKLSPHEMTSWLKISNLLLARSAENVEARLRQVLARTMALKLDLAALTGSGGQNQPLGLVNTSGIQDYNLGTNGAQFKFIDVTECEALLESAKHPTDGASFIFSHKVKKLLKKERIAQYSGDTGGAPYVLPMTDQNVKDFLGYNFATSSQIPTNLSKGSGTNLTYVAYGQFREMIMADWGAMEFGVSTDATDGSGNSAWLNNETWLKLTGAFDIGFYYPDAFVVSDEATTS